MWDDHTYGGQIRWTSSSKRGLMENRELGNLMRSLVKIGENLNANSLMAMQMSGRPSPWGHRILYGATFTFHFPPISQLYLLMCLCTFPRIYWETPS